GATTARTVPARMMLARGELEPCVRSPAESGAAAGTVACTVPWAPGGRILSEEVIAEFTRRRDDTSSRALGWDTPSGRSSAGDYFTGEAFGHTGFTGTSIWIDPELDLFVVLLTNRVNPTRENQRHVELRRTVHDLAARAITDRVVEPRR
ncbi:MAG: serine hydrolase, partial [Gemmatimonadota bacterium]